VRTGARRYADPEQVEGSALASLAMLSLPALIEAANDGNAIVQDAVRDAGMYLGIAIANLINIMNPSVVVIGGPVMGFGELLLDRVREEVRQRALWDALRGVAIVASTLNDDAGTIGAAALFLKTLDVATLVAPEANGNRQ
jgi:glucokinase